MNAEVNRIQCRKPMLTVVQQIEHLKSKGVRFELCSEEEAADYLANYNNYLRTASYRKLYPVQDQGPHKGEYLGLDFGHLKLLSSLDRQLRTCLLETAVDIEHFAHVKALKLCEENNENGYAIVFDFVKEMNQSGRKYLENSLKVRSSDKGKRDEYSGRLIAHYQLEAMPIWVLLESIDFGCFNSFYLFCSRRWDSNIIKQEHYILRRVQALRNACAHNSCILNGIARSNSEMNTRINPLLAKALNENGMKRTKSRRSRLSNPRTLQIVSTLYAESLFCSTFAAHKRHANSFRKIRMNYQKVSQEFEKNNIISSFFDFFFENVDIWIQNQTKYKSDIKPQGL